MKISGCGQSNFKKYNQTASAEIRRRSSGVWAHSGPRAPAWNFCSQIVQTLAASEMKMKGRRASKVRGRKSDRFHQRQRRSTTGNITVDGLLVMAARKLRSASR